MTEVEHALRWAMAELRGETTYSDAGQRQACFDRADAALKAIATRSVSPDGNEGRQAVVNQGDHP